MNTDLNILSSGTATVAYLVLSLMLLARCRGNRSEAILLLLAVAATAAWQGAALAWAYGLGPGLLLVTALELVRDLMWLTLFVRVMGLTPWRLGDNLNLIAAVSIAGVTTMLLTVLVLPGSELIPLPGVKIENTAFVFGFVLVAIVGLVLIEQLYRNSDKESRWSIKFLCIGLGGIFAYDFYLYSNALLLKAVDPDLWNVRGLINAMVVPLLAISAQRNKDWSIQIFASKRIVFHTVALLGTGVYLMMMAVAGYYIRDFGGTWGGALQAAFLFGALGLLFVLLFSGQVRARIKFFLNKHFFQYKYDYREEWLRFISTLSQAGVAGTDTRDSIVRAVAEIVESPGGILWMRGEGPEYDAVARVAFPERLGFRFSSTSTFASYLQEKQWVIDLDEYRQQPDMYEGLELPEWLLESRQAWLVVPLLHMDELLGVIVLARSRGNFTFNWEDVDLLKTVGHQAAGYLALMMTNDALSEARQFETFSRLSAYVVHDVKNMVAQLSLVVSNARRHMNNPEFIEDAITTVDNTVGRMNRLLEQLRKDRTSPRLVERVDVCNVLNAVVELREKQSPVPTLFCDVTELVVNAEKERFQNIIEHLVQNAQDACDDDGVVKIGVESEAGVVVIKISDNGTGMDEKFIRDRLFKPFDTTKGNAGMGVGVYQSREFVRSHGGEINVQSTPKVGTTFTVKLPLAVEHEEMANVSLSNSG